ncbi:Methyltransferase [Hexamita inflata]|uniref:Cap-specific mRNA (nucleoside-2'-O-)-methyltransferase 1 n=1 Tax=Hexamita inflata TaxID=28002 RepID=A0AA86V2P7_9EUKA|nr:Methyltransferase [Hexamita inflata]
MPTILREDTLTFTYKQKKAENSYVEMTPFSVYDEEQYIKTAMLPQEALAQYIKAQHRLDPIFDNDHGKEYSYAREIIFPKSRKGSNKGFANRAGDKLDEILQVSKVKLKTDIQFADVCAAPGAWSLYLLQYYGSARGVGMSMPILGTKVEDTWYPQLRQNPRFKATFGVTETGDVYDFRNIAELAKVCSQSWGEPTTVVAPPPEKPLEAKPEILPSGLLDLVTCDGGFQIAKSPTGQHCEQLQEIITQRLLLSEFLVALQLLKENGTFVCKMYDCICPFNVQLIFLMSQMFEETVFVKPEHSRVVNAEKYVVFKSFQPQSSIIEKIKQIHAEWKADTCYYQIIEESEELKQFCVFVNRVNETLVKRCTDALNVVIDKTEELVRQKANPVIKQTDPSAPQTNQKSDEKEWNDIFKKDEPRDYYRDQRPYYNRRDNNYRRDDRREYNDRNQYYK